jgi:hypothetical protein
MRTDSKKNTGTTFDTGLQEYFALCSHSMIIRGSEALLDRGEDSPKRLDE